MTIPAMVRRPMRRTFGGAAEFGVNARCGDLGDGLAAPDQRPGIEQQQRGNHRRLNNVAKHDLQDDRCFQHQGTGAHSLATMRASRCSVASGMALAPNLVLRVRASAPDSPGFDNVVAWSGMGRLPVVPVMAGTGERPC